MADRNLSPQSVTEQVIARFWKRVDKSSGHGPNGDCWVWTGYIWKSGYGCFSLSHRLSIGAHRFAYWTAHRERLSQFVCHKCDYPSCVKPDHLFEGSASDNMQDAMRKGRIGWTPKVVVPKTVLGTNISEGILRSSRRPVGEVNHKAKLTNELVLEIRRMWATGNYTKNALALAFGVKAPAIYKIVERRTWKHI